MKKKNKINEKARLALMILISIFVIVTGIFFSYGPFKNGEFAGGILGIIIAIIILGFAIFVYRRGNRDLKKGYPLKDERSIRILEKASSMAFYVSLYALLAIGFLSDEIIPFRDVSQATSVTVGFMALLFAIFWFYYNRKEM
ncbi:MAG: DUF2178 domain-containing protein [archaeon]